MSLTDEIKRLFGGKTPQMPAARAARLWSNAEIARLAPLATGDVINVSAWQDEDKAGRHYRDYFAKAASYSLSNYEGWRGEGVRADHVLDLSAPLPAELEGRFDLVFNHTTLEHVFEFPTAFRNICAMSRDAVMIVVPFMQHLHGPEDGDFWRPSPYTLRRFFAASSLTPLYESAGPKGGAIRYLLVFAAREPEAWAGRLPRPDHDAIAVLREPLGRR